MKPKYKPNITNRPKHIVQNDCFYFITVRTIEGQWFLQPDKYKQVLLDKIQEKINKFDLKLIAFVILNNHYHLIIQIGNPLCLIDQSLNKQTKVCTTRNGSPDISRFVRELNGSSSRAINQADHVIDRRIWWNYYDHIIRDEADFFKHLNYIHQNPIKHGLSKGFDYRFSSFNSWVEKKGREYLDHSFEKYPIIDFVMKNDI